MGQRTDAGAAQVALFVGVGTASSGAGRLMYRCPIGAITAALAFTATTADTLTVPGHSFSVNDAVGVFTAPGMTIPTGLTEGALVYVRTISGNDITLTATSGGGTNIDITAAGAGFIAKFVGLSITQNITPQIGAGQLVFRED
jgi:hypothetical protein